MTNLSKFIELYDSGLTSVQISKQLGLHKSTVSKQLKRYYNKYKHKSVISLKDRFNSKVYPEPNTGCWLWSGSLLKSGYGQINTRLPNGGWGIKTTHRLSYELNVGEIPNGLQVCHKCDVRSCVNPYHLFLGTQKDNVDDMIMKGRHKPNSGRRVIDDNGTVYETVAEASRITGVKDFVLYGRLYNNSKISTLRYYD